MKVDIDTIMSWRPCYNPETKEYDRESVTKHFKSVCGRRKYMRLKDAVKLDIPPADIYWLVFHDEFLTNRQMHEIALWCAEEIALPIWEKYYPDDHRPRDGIRVKRLWLDGKATDHELSVSSEAAYAAARTAADAADAVTIAAVYAVTIAAVYAAHAAADAAIDAARTAADAAAYAAARTAADASADAIADGAIAYAAYAAYAVAHKRILKKIASFEDSESEETD